MKKFRLNTLITKEEILNFIRNNDGSASRVNASRLGGRTLSEFYTQEDLALEDFSDKSIVIPKPVLSTGPNITNAEINVSITNSSFFYFTNINTSLEYQIFNDGGLSDSKIYKIYFFEGSFYPEGLSVNNNYQIRARVVINGSEGPWSDTIEIANGVSYTQSIEAEAVIVGKDGYFNNRKIYVKSLNTDSEETTLLEIKLYHNNKLILENSYNKHYFNFEDGLLDYRSEYDLYFKVSSVTRQSNWKKTTFKTGNGAMTVNASLSLPRIHNNFAIQNIGDNKVFISGYDKDDIIANTDTPESVQVYLLDANNNKLTPYSLDHFLLRTEEYYPTDCTMDNSGVPYTVCSKQGKVSYIDGYGSRVNYLYSFNSGSYDNLHYNIISFSNEKLVVFKQDTQSLSQTFYLYNTNRDNSVGNALTAITFTGVDHQDGTIVRGLNDKLYWFGGRRISYSSTIKAVYEVDLLGGETTWRYVSSLDLTGGDLRSVLLPNNTVLLMENYSGYRTIFKLYDIDDGSLTTIGKQSLDKYSGTKNLTLLDDGRFVVLFEFSGDRQANLIETREI